MPAGDRQRLLRFVRLLAKWNSVYNLTAVRDPQEMVTVHLLDSLAVLPHLRGPRVLDVGSGAGLPGVPLALARPGLQFVLLDANAKKIRFIAQAVAELALPNVEAVHARVERYRPAVPFDTVLARAFGSIAAMLDVAGGHLAAGGRLLALKGGYPEEELRALPPGWRVAAVEPLQVPGLRERHVVIVTRQSD